MKDSTKRSILRWIHIIFAIPIAGYVYSPFKELPNYAPRRSICCRSWHCSYWILDVERPRRSQIIFEDCKEMNLENCDSD